MPRPSTPPEPWDWPPPKRGRWKEPPTIEAKVVHETVRVVRPRPGPRGILASPKRDAAWVLVQILKAIVAIPIALVVMGALWLMTVLATLPKP